MFNSIECRSPLVDTRVIEFSMGLKDSEKLHKNNTKLFLRQLLRKKMRGNYVERQKMGFGNPIGKWLKKDLFDWANDKVNNSNDGISEIINIELIKSLWIRHQSNKADFSTIIWNFIMFKNWYIENEKINLILKSVLDYFLGVLLAIMLIPIQVVITLLIFFVDGKPVFFVQTRAGQFGREFKLFKFRTIFNNNGKKFVSKLGKFLRYTRLDELPQLYNLITGDISLVGPRPLYKKYIKLYNKEQIKRLNFKPGITGWAQINGDNNIS